MAASLRRKLAAALLVALPLGVAAPVVAFERSDPEPWLREHRLEMEALESVASELDGREGRVLSIGLSLGAARFYLNGGFSRRASFEVRSASSIRGTSDGVHWRVEGKYFPVRLDPTLSKLIRLSGQKGENLLKIAPAARRELVQHELATGVYDHAVLREPWPEHAGELGVRIAESWELVATAPVGSQGRIALYRRR